MKKLLLLFAVLMSTVSAWAQTDNVTSINPEKWYQLRCSDSTHGKLADNGTSLEGRAGTASFFQFIAASDGKYYIKSLNTGKYIGGDVASATSETKEDRLDEESPTEWTIAKLNGEATYVHISNGTQSYLNNAGGSGTLQIKYHGTITANNGCSLWYLTEYDSPITNLGEIAENGTNQSSWTKYSWHVEANIPNDVATVESTKYPDSDTAIRSVSFTITAKTGSLVSTLNYANGSNRLDILGADLLDASGNVVSEDYHFGYTGNAKENNTYILKVENDANYTIRYWVTFDNEANTSNGNINIYHSSDDLTDCTLKHLTQIGEINNTRSYFLRTSRGSLFYNSEYNSGLASTRKYPSSANKDNARWAIYKHTDNRYYLYNLSAKKFVGKNTDNAGVLPWMDENNSPISDVQIVASTKNAYPFVFSTDNSGAINHFGDKNDAPGVANWAAGSSSGGLKSLGDDGSAHQIIEASILTDDEIAEIQDKLAAQTISFTYSLKYDGTQRLTQSCTESVGQPYPDITVELPYGIVAQKPEGTVLASVGGTTIDINLGTNLPFEVSADYANAKWYFMKLNPNGFRYLYHTASETHIALDHSNVDIDNMDAYQWAFVGNPFDGFKIYNKLAGDGKILSSSTTMTVTKTSENDQSGTVTSENSDGAWVFPILTDAGNIPEGNNTYWMLTQSNNNSKGFYIAQKGFPNNRMNNRESKLAYWTGGADHGSTFVVEEPVRTEWLYEKDKVFWTSKNIGIYPAGLNNTEACGGNKGNSSSHIGVEGHSVNKAEMMVYADAVNVFTTFKYRTDADHAIMPLGVDLVDKNGNVVASDYHLGFAGGEHYSNTYNFNVPESGTYILRFFVCNESLTHNLGETHGNITVVGVKEATQEQTDAFCTELKSVTNNLYTTKYEPCKGDAYAYYQTSTVETLKSAIDNMASGNTVLNAGALVDANDAVVFIVPQTGKFYRIKGKHSGEYISGTATLGSKFNIEAETEANKDALVFYLTEDSKLMNFRTGTYLKDTDTEGNVGDAGCKVFFNSSESSNGGYFTLKTDASGSKYMYDDGNPSDDDDCLNRNAGYAAAYCEWQIEDVTELPLPIHSSGLSTFSASVDLEIPEGVTVYYAKSNDGETIRMSPLTDVIPANTGVVVQGEGTVSFPITTGATALENNLLKPVVAAQAVTAATGNSVFVLGTRDEVTGFYPLSTTNKTISGHKSYLEIPTPQAARLSIVWDDTETGIHEAEGGEQNAEIYDLTGRRLDKPAKGVNVIGGKLVIK